VLIGEEWVYEPTVVDPGGDEVDVQILVRLPGMVLTPGGGVRWTPTEEDVGEHALVFTATDDEDDPEVEGDGDSVQEILLTVSQNLPPGQPVIESPGRGDDVHEARPTIVVRNPEDPEGDTLTIGFEVDTSDTFTDPIASGPQAAGADGTTSWQVAQDLVDGGRYHLRVWASDGTSEGPRATSFFFVDLRGEDGGPDGGPGPDAGPGDDGGPEGPVVDPGCACRSGAGSTAAAPMLALLALLGLWPLRASSRRRRGGA
jgi:MYXO-CTERM domain-containing protein